MESLSVLRYSRNNYRAPLLRCWLVHSVSLYLVVHETETGSRDSSIFLLAEEKIHLRDASRRIVD